MEPDLAAIKEIIEAAVKWRSADPDHPDTPPREWQLIIPLLKGTLRLVDAASDVVGNAIDCGEFGPPLGSIDSDANWPRDADGDPWYHDLWELQQAIEATYPPKED